MMFLLHREKIEEWQYLVSAMDQVRSEGGAAVNFQGGMVDIAHEKTAIEMLEMCKKLGIILIKLFLYFDTG